MVKVHYGVRLRPDQLKYLKTLTKPSEWIREAIDEKRERENKSMTLILGPKKFETMKLRMTRTPKPIFCFIKRCDNYDCKYNDKHGNCAWGDKLNVKECSEYQVA